jgi:hypothetical protein
MLPLGPWTAGDLCSFLHQRVTEWAGSPGVVRLDSALAAASTAAKATMAVPRNTAPHAGGSTHTENQKALVIRKRLASEAVVVRQASQAHSGAVSPLHQ